jgi:hypothetical protein
MYSIRLPCGKGREDAGYTSKRQKFGKGTENVSYTQFHR